jgi:hypothetical protein
MDINDFGIEQEYFGLNGGRGGRFRQLQKSNTSFLNFTIEETPEYQTALRRHQSVMEDLITAADKKAEVDRFEKEIRNLRLQRGITGVQTGLSTFNNVMAQLGFKPTTTPTTTSTTQITGNQGQPRRFPWGLVIGGVVVLGLGVFAIYKFRK